MIDIGYKLSSEEFGPEDLVRFAGLAEQAGFSFGLIWITFIRGSTRRARARSCGA